MAEAKLKEKVHTHLMAVVPKPTLEIHDQNTTDSIDSQREFLKRIVMERAKNPLMEVDTVRVIDGLTANSICPFINNHI